MHPETRRLVLTWVTLMGLTLALAVSGDVAHPTRLGALWLAVIGLVTATKARLVLARYLRLEVAPSFLSGFTGALVATLAIVVVSFALIHKPLVPEQKPRPAPPSIGATLPRP